MAENSSSSGVPRTDWMQIEGSCEPSHRLHVIRGSDSKLSSRTIKAKKPFIASFLHALRLSSAKHDILAAGYPARETCCHAGGLEYSVHQCDNQSPSCSIRHGLRLRALHRKVSPASTHQYSVCELRYSMRHQLSWTA